MTQNKEKNQEKLDRGMLLQEAERIAIIAGNYLKEKYYSGFHSKNKGPKDIVTEADFGSEEIILKEIKKIFPNHNILAEESGESNLGSAYRWTIDPLDGTVNFSYGLPLFGVIISVSEENETVVAVHHLPLLGETYTATLGGGAYLNGQKISVSVRKDLAESIISLGDFNCGKTEQIQQEGNQKLTTIISKLAPITLRTKQMGAACLDLAFIATGRTDILIYPTEQPNDWDVLAGQLLIKEAGGKTIAHEGLTIFYSGNNTQELLHLLS